MARFPTRTLVLMVLALFAFAWFWWRTHQPRTSAPGLVVTPISTLDGGGR